MKLKCIHDDGCLYWTKWKLYKSIQDKFGFDFIDDNDRVGYRWVLEDNDDGTYSPVGITYRVNFIIEG